MTRNISSIIAVLLAGLGAASLLPAQATTEGAGGAAGADVVIFRPLHGSVEVEAWGQDSVRWEGGDESAARIEPEATGRVLELHERRRTDSARRVAYRLRVPRATRVRIVMRSGSISLAGLQGGARATVQDGEIMVSGAQGPLELRTVNGPITVRDVRGTVDASSVAGELELVDVEGAVRARNTSGDITVRGDRSASVDAESYSGRIRLEGPLSPAENSAFHSHSGAVRLALTPLDSATVHLRTVEGRLEVRCPGATSSESPSGRMLVLGSGSGTQVEVTTFSGPIEVSCAAS